MNKTLALAWALTVALVMTHLGFLWEADELAPETDILAMLPQDERDPVVQKALTHLAEVGEQRLMVLVGAADWQQAIAASDAYRRVLAGHENILQLHQSSANATSPFATLLPYREGLATRQQRQLLQQETEDDWLATAQRLLYSPVPTFAAASWQQDPFGIFAGWVEERAQETPLRPFEEYLRVDSGAMTYVVLPFVLQGRAFALAAQEEIMPLLQQAETAAHSAVANCEILTSGMVLHAAAASAQAHQEISIIGYGSLAGILLLMWICFRSLGPIFWVVVSIGVGFLGALSFSYWLFGSLHLLTLVFGASLIGVAEDYGIHYLCARLTHPHSPKELLRYLLPGLSLAVLTTVVAYLGLALTPFPGLQQIAVFSSVGLVFAWLTVVCWFPFVNFHQLHGARMVRAYAKSRVLWPTLGRNQRSLIAVGLVVLFCAIGMLRLRGNDDIRLLQNSPQHLLTQQMRVNQLLDAPALGHFFVLRGTSAEELLQREEALTAELDAMHTNLKYNAVSNWVPSIKTQHETRAWVHQATDSARRTLSQMLGQELNNSDVTTEALVPEDFMASAAGEAARHLWLGNIGQGYASIVTLRGATPEHIPNLQHINLAGVHFVNKVQDISNLLGRYRMHMAWVLLFSYGAVFLLTLLRYRARAWRVLAPAAAGSLIALALLGWLGTPLNLFHVLALLLILGMGVDYGIFLQEHPSTDDDAAWLAVSLSSVSTLLSFGLLALSHTPALHSFGTVMLVGVGLAWGIAPMLAPKGRE